MGQQFTTLQRCIEVDVSLNALNIAGLHGHDEEYKLSTLKSYLSQNVLQLIDSFNLPPYQFSQWRSIQCFGI